jgi:hypothetical protein
LFAVPGKAITALITITSRIEATHYGNCRPLEALSRWTKRKHLREVAGIDRI